ncbi:YciI family protein [Aliiroseovarius sp. YM-037]|uniref:YciI family protein n=1 Tax=Aliiroseovarius sp. YM-037 TaxID=3341728 RepID=UPI003A7FA65F
MPNFVFAFHGGSMPDTPEESAKVMAEWGAWMEGMGSALVHPGAPVGKSSTVSQSGVADDGGPNPISGFIVVEASDQNAAVEMAKGCPGLKTEATVEVAEMMQM